MAKAGYPLEVDVTSLLLQNRWSIIPQYAYFDKDLKKMRSIDVVAYYFGKGGGFTEFPRMIIECKTRKENPWIFHCSQSFFQDLTKLDRIGLDILTMTSITYTYMSLFQKHIDWEKNVVKPSSLPESIERVNKIHFFNKALPRASSCHVAFRSGKRGDSIDDFHKAVYQLRGACLYLAHQVPNWPIFTTIVLRGKMFEYFRESNRQKLKESKHILFSTFWLLPETEFQPSQHSFPPVIIDVVSDSYFSDYLELIKRDFEILMHAYENLKGEKT